MRRSHVLILATLAASFAVPAGAAPGQGPTGVWNRDDGLGGVRIAHCGAALCGHIVWLKNPEGPGHVGQRVLYDMRKTAENSWAGSAHNPEDGGTYAGTMILAGDRLSTRGCALGGAICQTVGLTRARR